MLFYYVFIFVYMQDYLKARRCIFIFIFICSFFVRFKTRSYSTLYDRVAGNQMKAIFSHKRVAVLPDLVKVPIYHFFVFFKKKKFLLESSLHVRASRFCHIHNGGRDAAVSQLDVSRAFFDDDD
jgi:hypothetical protein